MTPGASSDVPVTLMSLDPGHFHAALLQKTMLVGVSPEVYIYAPEGADLAAHVQRLEQFNRRAEQPTHWRLHVHAGPDYLEAMLRQRPGTVVVIAGVNSRKAAYISAAVDAGLHVLADKPMCIDVESWQALRRSFDTAAARGVLLRDIMTSRHEITTRLSRLLQRDAAVFGTLQAGTPEHPAVRQESAHHLFKYVSGQPLRRPAWYFDVAQQGEGIVDVSTHMVEQVFWTCFAEQAIDYDGDITLLRARRWPTALTQQQFAQVTGLQTFPPDLQEQLDAQGRLQYSCNGEIDVRLRGVHVRLVVQWHFQAPPGGDDTHTSEVRGTRSTLYIRQAAAQRYRREIYVQPQAEVASVERALRQRIDALQEDYPGLGLQQHGEEWQVTIPESYRSGHEAQFGKVIETFLQHVQGAALPAWEVPNVLARYYITTQALRLAQM